MGAAAQEPQQPKAKKWQSKLDDEEEARLQAEEEQWSTPTAYLPGEERTHIPEKHHWTIVRWHEEKHLSAREIVRELLFRRNYETDHGSVLRLLRNVARAGLLFERKEELQDQLEAEEICFEDAMWESHHLDDRVELEANQGNFKVAYVFSGLSNRALRRAAQYTHRSRSIRKDLARAEVKAKSVSSGGRKKDVRDVRDPDVGDPSTGGRHDRQDDSVEDGVPQGPPSPPPAAGASTAPWPDQDEVFEEEDDRKEDDCEEDDCEEQDCEEDGVRPSYDPEIDRLKRQVAELRRSVEEARGVTSTSGTGPASAPSSSAAPHPPEGSTTPATATEPPSSATAPGGVSVPSDGVAEPSRPVPGAGASTPAPSASKWPGGMVGLVWVLVGLSALLGRGLDSLAGRGWAALERGLASVVAPRTGAEHLSGERRAREPHALGRRSPHCLGLGGPDRPVDAMAPQRPDVSTPWSQSQGEARPGGSRGPAPPHSPDLPTSALYSG